MISTSACFWLSAVMPNKHTDSPRCHPSVDKVYRYGASNKGSIRTIPLLAIRCQMDADAMDRLHFTWIAYNSSGSNEWHVFHPSAHQVMNETTSQLSYRPSSLNEELTIECWANNSAYINSSVHEPEPCVFHIEPYGKCCGCWLYILSYSMYLYVYKCM